MDLYRTTKHENAERIVLPMRRYRVIDSDRKRTQDRGALSHKEGNFGVCSDLCIHSTFSFGY